MEKIFDKGVLHIILDQLGYFLITSDIDSKVYVLSEDKETKQIETYTKASYVYRYDINSIFVPSMYYRAVGYKKDIIKKYKTKIDLLEGNRMAAFNRENVYYFNEPSGSNAKLWKLNLESGINEEIKFDIPKRKNRKIRYTYISINKDELIIFYYYFGEQELCFDDMFMRVYRIVDDKYELLDEKFVDVGVRAVYSDYSDEVKGKVLLFEKVVCENGRISVKGEYLGLLNNEKEINKIFNVPDEMGNGLISYAISFEKGIVVLMWKHKVLTYDLDTEEPICNLTNLLKKSKNEGFSCVRFDKDKLLVASDSGLFELEEKEYFHR